MGPSTGPHPLTVFVFLWACQALVHQEFYQIWIRPPMISGWILTLAAVCVLLRPRAMLWFAVMLAASITYNVSKWPFVVNHILVESLVDFTILAALGWTLFRRGVPPGPLLELDPRTADEVYARFAPVLRGMVIVMYAFAFVAKLNSDFLDANVSCTAVMYGRDILHIFPFAPDTHWARVASLWGTIAIEASIPALLCFRRTRVAAIAIGLPFHLMLGLIGHRTFSGLVYAAYFLFVDRRFLGALGFWSERIGRRLGVESTRRALTAARWLVPAAITTLVAFATMGISQIGIGPLRLPLDRIPILVWILWSLLMMSVYFRGIVSPADRTVPTGSPEIRPASPGVLWGMVGVVFLNGMNPYVGLKTETAFTMYSNLRTEGGGTNHLFMPSSLKIAGFQEDLVEVLDSDNPRLREFAGGNYLLTYFEFRRLASGIQGDFTVGYLRNGDKRSFVRKDGVASDPELVQPHPVLLAKLLYFRPVRKNNDGRCPH
jgi:hypothetical protein